MTANSTDPDIGRRMAAIEEAIYNLQRERSGAPSTIDNCPTGMIAGFPTQAGAQGWIPLAGQAIDAATYPALHRYLTGNGLSTTLPDFRGRFPVGAGGLYNWTSTGGSADAIVVAHVHAQNVSAALGGAGVRTDYDADAASDPFPQGINTGSTGSSGTGANLPPYRGLYWMIRT